MTVTLPYVEGKNCKTTDLTNNWFESNRSSTIGII